MSIKEGKVRIGLKCHLRGKRRRRRRGRSRRKSIRRRRIRRSRIRRRGGRRSRGGGGGGEGEEDSFAVIFVSFFLSVYLRFKFLSYIFS